MSGCTFAAPVKSLNEAVAKGTLGELNPTPWAFMIGNCIGWIGYSYVIQDFFVLAANVPGLFISLWLNTNAAKLLHMDTIKEANVKDYSRLEGEEKENDISGGLSSCEVDDGATQSTLTSTDEPNLRENHALNGSTSSQHEKLVFGMIAVWLLLFTVIAFADVSQHSQELVIGNAVNINLAFFLAAPLSTIFHVLRVRDSSSIHLRTMVLNTVNSTFWFLYGISLFDPFIFVSNGAGVVFGVAQVVLYAFFPHGQQGTTHRCDETAVESLSSDEALRHEGLSHSSRGMII